MNDISKKFLYVESSQIPLIKVDYDDIKKETINPLTNKPYKGIVLFGEFADLSNNSPNNNKRIYDVEQYLILLGELRKKVHEKKGVYGELEHPNSYAVNYQMVSHKILDVYYDENTQKVMGYVLILDTPEGKKVQEIIKSGGCVAISARAAGEEINRNDGSKLARVKLLTTYDLVYHPGFSSAVLDFKELNESYKFGSFGSVVPAYSCIIYENQLKSLNESFDNFKEGLMNGEISGKCFFSWYSSLSESEKPQKEKSEEKKDEKKLEDLEQPKEEEYQDELQKATKQDLSEQKRKKYINRLKKNQHTTIRNLSRYGKLGNALYDNSAGFLTDGIAGLPNINSVNQ